MALQAVSIVLVVLQLVTGNAGIGGAIFSIAISAIIIYYLNQPAIRAAFGRPAA